MNKVVSQSEGQKSQKPSVPLHAYSVAQAAQALGVHPNSIRSLIRRGFLRPSRALRHLKIPVQQIDDLLESTTSI